MMQIIYAKYSKLVLNLLFSFIANESSPIIYLAVFRNHYAPFIFTSQHLGYLLGIYLMFFSGLSRSSLSCILFRDQIFLLFRPFLARFFLCILLMLNVLVQLLFLIHRLLFDQYILLIHFLYFSRISLVVPHSYHLNLLRILPFYFKEVIQGVVLCELVLVILHHFVFLMDCLLHLDIVLVHLAIVGIHLGIEFLSFLIFFYFILLFQLL